MKIIESLAPVEKMLLFEKGLRKENVKACSNEKLDAYLYICKNNNFSTAGRAIELELLNRHLLQNTEAEFITFTVDGLIKYEENIINALYKFFVTKTSIVSEADLLKQLTEVDNGRSIQDFMRSLGRITGIAAILISKLKNANYTKQLVAILTDPKLARDGPYVSKDQLSRILKNLISNQKVLNSLSTIISSYQVDQNELKEAIEKHDTLNPKLWTAKGNLKPAVKEKIFNIVIDFINGLKEDGIKFNLKDIVLVGSNCSYNYNKDSDLDIHLRLSTKGLVCPDNLYPLLYSAYRSLFNKKHDISFYDIPVEVFVETAFDQENDSATEQKLNSAGVYSVLQDTWLKKPEPADVPEINQGEIDELVAPWAERYLQIRYKPTIEAVDKYIEDIYDLRKAGIAVSEFDPRNLVFKEIRSRGYLDDLKSLKDKLVSKQYSLD